MPRTWSRTRWCAPWNARDQFSGRGQSTRGWLLAILHNRFVDATRSRRRAEAGPQRRCRRGPGTRRASRGRSIRCGWRRCAARSSACPDEQRAALHLVAIEGLSYQAAADALAIPLGTLMVAHRPRPRGAARK
jgi:RNA polymerase sigma-70 factor (ECF subfamily)